MVDIEKLVALPVMFYREWYRKDVAPNLTMKQKKALLQKISDVSLERPIITPSVYFTKKEFPELAPYMHTEKLSGLQLYAVMTEIFNEVYKKSKVKLKEVV